MRCLVAAALLLLALAAGVSAQEATQDDWSLMELGATATISSRAAQPMQDVARLLSQANRSIRRMSHSRQPYNVVSNHIRVRRKTNVQLPPAPARASASKGPRRADHVNAELVEPMQQPTVVHPQVFGTRYPIEQEEREFVVAEIVGEDGKPYAPRKQWDKIEDDPATFRSPFAKYIHPPAVGSSADVANKDGNIKLTDIERRTVESLQFRLRNLLQQLGANLVWDHTKVANRRLVAEFDAIREEAKAMLEEYELRTGVKTIAWQLQENDAHGLTTPRGGVTDIHFAKQPEIATRPLQRKDSRTEPPMLDKAALQALQAAHGLTPEGKPIVVPPKEQRVNVAWKKQADGVVKAKVNLQVVDSSAPTLENPANLNTRVPVPGKVSAKSGKVGPASLPVQVDVVAPQSEQLARAANTAAPPLKVEGAPTVQVSAPPKINL